MINFNPSSTLSSFESLSWSSENEDCNKSNNNDSFHSLSWSTEDLADHSPSSVNTIISTSSIMESSKIFSTDKEKWANEPYKTATVIPYYWNADEQQGYFLMAEDVEKVDKAVRLNDWSVFGGYCEDNETEPVDTAIRECNEESIGLLEDLKYSLKNKRCVEFKWFKSFIYVVNLFPKNIEERCYSLNQINDFHKDFNKLSQNILKDVQKEKKTTGLDKSY